MSRDFLPGSVRVKTAWIILILVLLTLPVSTVLGARSSMTDAAGEGQIPTWEPPLDPAYTRYDNFPVTYDPIKGAVKQGRFPDCKTCLPDETSHNKPNLDLDPAWPASPTVKLIATWPSNDTTHCSGMLVDSAALLTAGHCVFTHTSDYCNSEPACWASNLEVILNYQQDDEQTSGYTQILSWTAWTENRDFQYDLAGIKLDQPLGGTFGWLGFGYNNDSQHQFFPNTRYEHTSYPVGTPGEMNYWNGFFSRFEEHHFVTEETSLYGQGGAGVHSNAFDHQHIIYSVLSHHTLETPSQTAYTRITPEKFFALRDWINGGIKDKNFEYLMPYFRTTD